MSDGPADERDHKDAGEISEGTATDDQHNSHDQTEYCQQCLTAERAEFDERDRIRSDEAGVFQPNECEKDADSCGGSDSQFSRNCFRNGFANRRDGDQKKQHAGPEDDSECNLPPHFLSENDREGEEGVDTHPRRDCKWKFCVDAHQQRHHKTDQHGGGQHTTESHAGSGR